jgi:hypothetical protein
MFGSKSRRIKNLEEQLRVANERLKRVIEEKLPQPGTADERIALAKRKKECEELDICHICGKQLISVDNNPEDENLPEFWHECPDHGVMFIERW